MKDPDYQSIANDVLNLLSANGFGAEVQDLADRLAELKSPDQQLRKQAREAIEQRCKPRWLGDLYIDGSTLADWWGKLESLARAIRLSAS
ncbi:MAG TPA: hypothetical protein VGL59_11415 [Polyangia bacterium]|jgi:hypothetical protein